MKAELENRKRMLCAKRHQLKESTNENELLKEVMKDYDQYNRHLILQKEKQLVFFRQLNLYIDSVTKELKVTDHKLKETKYEQREIIKEIQLLKRELDDLVKDNADYETDA
jgi:septal ring factor EnvC (AmiA/AmiB activator)